MKNSDYLYIPIWLYSNLPCLAGNKDRFIFTFQSGYIQIGEGADTLTRKGSLHSNLVIFKSEREPTHLPARDLYIPIWLYSNIVTYILIFIKYHLYIPIWLYSNCVGSVPHKYISYLYIPIWLYSNAFSHCFCPSISILYIPIWLYSN